MVKRKNVILDCDPGHDDAFAMYVLLAAKNIDLLAVTTSSGNQTQEKTNANARKLLALAGREDIPVGRGFDKSIKGDLIIADNIHGESGIDGAILPDVPKLKKQIKAIDLIAKTIKELNEDEKVTLVVTGPQTNIGIFLLAYPELHEKIELISFMGGAAFGGNWSSRAEFNIYADPYAADIVLESGIPTAMFGLDVTLKASFMEEDIDRVREIKTPVGENFVGILEFFKTKVAQPFLAPEGHIEGQHLHDVCAAAYLIDPSLFTMVPLNVTIDTQKGLNFSSTIVDYNEKSGRQKNALVGFDVNREKLVDLIIDSLSKF